MTDRSILVPTRVGVDRHLYWAAFVIKTSSPRAWGWTAHKGSPPGGSALVPTRVGVDRVRIHGDSGRQPRPHARGGGPEGGSWFVFLPLSSPRAWGWTAGSQSRESRLGARPHARGGGPQIQDIAKDAHTLVPTRVGVDRIILVLSLCLACSSPRAWGWTAARAAGLGCPDLVPTRVGVDRLSTDDQGCPGASSPRAWGWTAQVSWGQARQALVPTRVGVDRQSSLSYRPRGPRPHARGGGPSIIALLQAPRPSSPRAWGWTGCPRFVLPGQPLVPTRVGVDRDRPHRSRRRRPSSPRAWGWTEPRQNLSLLALLVPTRVGVDRPRGYHRGCRPPRPHARGGGPSLTGSHWRRYSSSPRAWGWTGGQRRLSAAAGLVPTRVGVDRSRATPPGSTSPRPHARGGGPKASWIKMLENPSSPRAWGWTG